jgi:hypothetical protein
MPVSLYSATEFHFKFSHFGVPYRCHFIAKTNLFLALLSETPVNHFTA